MKHSRLLLTVALGLGLAVGLLWMLRCPSGSAQARSDLMSTLASLARHHDPVIITGGLLSDLVGNPLNEIFVYARQGTALTQIPFQIDERDGGAMYTSVGDGQLGDDDELVFMATDGGGWVVNPSLDVGGTLITPTYVITLTDPISDTHAWAYVFHSPALSRTLTTDYVSYDGDNDRITSPGRYAMGFDADHGFMDHLTLGGDERDLLDRSKLRISGTVEFLGNHSPFSLSEQDVTRVGVHTVDGPVRVTRVSTNTLDIGPGLSIPGRVTLFAYRSLIVLPDIFTVPGEPVQIACLRSSMDWNEQAVGMAFYDANNPAGVIVDGSPDVVTTTPVSRWGQFTSVTGTVVSVSEIPARLGGTQSTYYKDDAHVADLSDTGDQLSYGDAGLQVCAPSTGTHTMLGHTYFLTGVTANVGATYVNYYDNPIQVSVATFTPQEQTIYLPLVAKSH
jgi:hypothetical protein